MRFHQIKTIFIVCCLINFGICLLPAWAVADDGETEKQCCPLKSKTVKTEQGELKCCNGPNGANGFDDDCCKAQKGRVIENKDGTKKCCKNKDPQQS